MLSQGHAILNYLYPWSLVRISLFSLFILFYLTACGGTASDDSDGDGVRNSEDAFPLDASESVDSDGDGVGDNEDAFPFESLFWLDSDGDHIPDLIDWFPFDLDNDGEPDSTDDFPNNPFESKDTDSDGVGDNLDAFPEDSSKSKFSIAGSITGLKGSISIQLNDQIIIVSANKGFDFEVGKGTDFTIEVSEFPVSQLCTVSNSTYTALSDIEGIAILCEDRILISDVLKGVVDQNFLDCLDYKWIEYIDQVKSVICKKYSITNDYGLADFTHLTQLDLSFNQLTSVDLKSNIELETVRISENNLESIELTSNPKIGFLSLANNRLEVLNINENPEISFLVLSDNLLTSLDTSGNPYLHIMTLNDNEFTKANLSESNVKFLELNNNKLTSIGGGDFSAELYSLKLNGNSIIRADFSENSELSYLYIEDNELISMDLKSNEELYHLYVKNNNLSGLDVSSNLDLFLLDLENNKITGVDLSNNERLRFLNLASNKLTNLDLSHNPELKTLYLNDNRLTTIPVGLSGILDSLAVIDLTRNPFDNEAREELIILKERYRNLVF